MAEISFYDVIDLVDTINDQIRVDTIYNNLPKNKKSKHCSFCNFPGHNIRKCCNENKKLIRYLIFNVFVCFYYSSYYSNISHISLCMARILNYLSKSNMIMFGLIINAPINLSDNKTTIMSCVFKRFMLLYEIKIHKKLQKRRPVKKMDPFNDIIGLIECPICYDDYDKNKVYKTNCDHIFCMSCINKHLKHSNDKNECPCCRTKIKTLSYYMS